MLGFADITLAQRKTKCNFFEQIDKLIDWAPIEKIIKRHYYKGFSVVGRPSIEGLLLFKMCLLQTWYGLSDYEIEDQVNDRLSFSRFIGLSLDEKSPDHSVVIRFRTELTKKRAFEKLLNAINTQLIKHNIIVKQGLIVDAKVTDTPRKPKGKKEYEAAEDRNEESTEPNTILKEKLKSNVDKDAKWIKKAGKLHFGYKQHTGTDENGLILGIVTTPANESDIKHLPTLIDKIKPKKGTWVKADKGYKSAQNDEYLTKNKLRNHIMKKAQKNKKLKEREQVINKLISKTRYKVERTFGSIKRWFKSSYARYVGIEKMHTQHLIEAIAYNLYRSPGILVSKCQ